MVGKYLTTFARERERDTSFRWKKNLCLCISALYHERVFFLYWKKPLCILLKHFVRRKFDVIFFLREVIKY